MWQINFTADFLNSSVEADMRGFDTRSSQSPLCVATVGIMLQIAVAILQQVENPVGFGHTTFIEAEHSKVCLIQDLHFTWATGHLLWVWGTVFFILFVRRLTNRLKNKTADNIEVHWSSSWSNLQGRSRKFELNERPPLPPAPMDLAIEWVKWLNYAQAPLQVLLTVLGDDQGSEAAVRVARIGMYGCDEATLAELERKDKLQWSVSHSSHNEEEEISLTDLPPCSFLSQPEDVVDLVTQLKTGNVPMELNEANIFSQGTTEIARVFDGNSNASPMQTNVSPMQKLFIDQTIQTRLGQRPHSEFERTKQYKNAPSEKDRACSKDNLKFLDQLCGDEAEEAEAVAEDSEEEFTFDPRFSESMHDVEPERHPSASQQRNTPMQQRNAPMLDANDPKSLRMSRSWDM